MRISCSSTIDDKASAFNVTHYGMTVFIQNDAAWEDMIYVRLQGRIMFGRCAATERLDY